MQNQGQVMSGHFALVFLTFFITTCNTLNWCHTEVELILCNKLCELPYFTAEFCGLANKLRLYLLLLAYYALTP